MPLAISGSRRARVFLHAMNTDARPTTLVPERPRHRVATAAVGGVVLVGGLVLGMNYNHPFTTDGRIYFNTTAIAPTVQGRVTEVPVKPNVPLKGGDTLFKIGPRSYQFVVKEGFACGS
jgi:multidrug resistance efflux pump